MSKSLSPAAKAAIIKLLEVDLSAAEDNLFRACSAFKGFNAEQMKADHGASGLTRQEVLDGYVVRRDEAFNVLAEARTL